MVKAFLSSILLAAGALAKIKYAGVAESGGEFGVYSATATPGTGLPGTFGVDYAFINKSSIDVWVAQNKASAQGQWKIVMIRSLTLDHRSIPSVLPSCWSVCALSNMD